MPVTEASRQANVAACAAILTAALCLLAALATAPPAPAATSPAIDTTITGGPAEGAIVVDPRVTFSFEAALAGVPFPAASFRCSVDDAPAAPCTSPFQTAQLEEGAHSFSVFAEDPQQFIADPTPARRTFSVISPEEECEVFEDEDGVEEEDPDCEEDEGSPENSKVPPEECVMRTARARVFTYASQNRIRLVIRYTAFDPGDVFVDYRLNGGKGGLKLGTAHQHFAKAGLLRVNEHLSESEMAKVRAAKGFTVTMTIPAAPRYCHRYDTRHLTIRRTIHKQPVWFQSDSVFGS
jgi:hypothetical protein